MTGRHICHFLAVAVELLLVAESAVAQTTVPLWPDGPPTGNGLVGPETENGFGCVGNVTEPTLAIHRPAESNGAAVLVVPGGGYGVVCRDHEGRAVAEWLTGLGYTAGVLKYRLPNGHYAVPFQDAQQALRMLRREAGVDGNVGILGFSAGGHLASTVGTHFDEDFSDGGGTNLDATNRPDFMVLVYPVITMEGTYTHAGSRENLLGEDPSPADVQHFSNELHVTDRTPPTFLVHADDDDVVHSFNSVHFYEALRDHEIPAELHLFEHGGHGFSLAPDSPAKAWAGLAATWLERVRTGG